MESTATTTADDQGAGALSIRKVAIIAGAIIAFLIGSGFATGQEILQYFASRGYIGVFGTGALVLVLMTFVCIQFIAIGRAQRFERPTDIYRFLCGKVVGTFFDWFSMVFVFMSFWVMVAGAGAVFAEHYGLSAWIGGLGLAIVVGITGVLGLNGLVEVIGKIGPIIVAVALTLGIAAILKHPGASRRAPKRSAPSTSPRPRPRGGSPPSATSASACCGSPRSSRPSARPRTRAARRSRARVWGPG